MSTMTTFRCALSLALVSLLALACSDPTSPGPGELVVLFTTSGVEPDEDGYILTVDNRPGELVAPNGEMRITDLEAGEHRLRVEGAFSNCTIQGLNPRTVVIARGAPTIVRILVTCVARTGFIDVLATTSGTLPDPDGYFVAVDGQPAQALTSSGFLSFGPLAAGAHSFVLSGVAPNCGVLDDSTRTAVVVGGRRDVLRFAVICTAFATMTVSTVTTGVDFDQSVYFSLETPSASYSYNFLGANASRTFVDLAPGAYTATLFDIALNCEPGPNPLTGTTAAGDTVFVTFQVGCTTARQLVYVGNVAGAGAVTPEIFVIKSNGAGETRLTRNEFQDLYPSWSPDGTRIAFASDRAGSNNMDIWVMNADGSNPVRLTTADSLDSDPSWSPDGSRIAFVSRRDGDAEIYVMNADGSAPVRLTTSAGADIEPAWSPDAARIAFRSARDGNDEIYLMAANGTGVTRVTRNAIPDGQPAWSPSGAKLAFTRFADGLSNIIVSNADGSAELLLATDFYSSHSEPAWSPDGRWIAFTTEDCYYGCTNLIQAVRTDGTRLTYIRYGYSPSWRP